MKKLISGEIKPNQKDIIELFSVIRESESWTGQRITLVEFGMWLCGDPRLKGKVDPDRPDNEPLEPCEMTW